MRFANAEHSHPEVSFPHGAKSSAPPDRQPPANELAPQTDRNGSLGESEVAPGNDGDFAALHEQHEQQIEAIGRERNDLACRLADVARELAQAHNHHADELERIRLERDAIIRAKEALGLQLAHLRVHQREQADAFAAERAELTTECKTLAAHLAESRARYQSETEALTRDHDNLAAALARERELRHREVTALAAQVDRLSHEHGELSAELDRTRERGQEEVEALTADRDALARAGQAATAEAAQRLDQHKTELAALATQHERMTQERYRISSEFSTFREGHYTAIEALTAERDQLRVAQAELRAHLGVLNESHRQELEELRREHASVIKEADEIHELLETDRLAWKKQVELFTAERETLTRERDETLAELVRERHAEDRQVELRSQECGNLLAQRAELLGQVEELRAAEKRQNTLIHEERRILCGERDHTAAKLAQCMEALGEERMTLLQQKNSAEGRLEAAKKEHAEEIAALEVARVEVAGERDAARRELAVFQDAQARERTHFGMVATRKHELAATCVREGLRMNFAAKDTALGREVELRMIHGGGTSDERRAELVEEVRHLARLQHPNIPPIYEASFDESGHVYYTTKPVAGMTLREVLNELERGKTSSLLHFSLRRLLSVFHRVCDTLAYAHAREIVHGDLKPEDVILGDFGEVFVTGWHLPRAGASEDERQPEFHPRDDITALGRILYEMTNLLHPPVADATAAQASKHGRKAPGRAWSGDKDVNALAAIAKRALDPKLAGRFYSVRELQMQVDAFKDSFDDPARVTLETILRQWVSRHRRALVIAAIALVLALAGGIWLATQRRPDRSQPRPSFHALDRLELSRPAPPPRDPLTSPRVPPAAPD